MAVDISAKQGEIPMNLVERFKAKHMSDNGGFHPLDLEIIERIEKLEAEVTKWKEVAASRKGAVEAINGGLEFAAVLRQTEQLQEQVKKLEKEIKEWESGAISRRWSEIRDDN